MERITVVKIGGNVIDSPEATARFVEAFAALEGPKLLSSTAEESSPRVWPRSWASRAAWSTGGASPTVRRSTW